ncbi:MAG: M20/M25/M40 family metallo-hydrolase [Bdellovibrio sp.]|nr:MAG: M20/M25/M40 family metallo-hydrolase [Bdellovibrio sp.]
MKVFCLLFFLWGSVLQAKVVVSEMDLLKAVHAPVLMQRQGLGVAQVSPAQESLLIQEAHKKRRCGGFTALDLSAAGAQSFSARVKSSAMKFFSQLSSLKKKEQRYLLHRSSFQASFLNKQPQPKIQQAIKKLKVQEIQNWVEWFSAFPSRYHRLPTANDPIKALKKRLEALASTVSYPVRVDLITHQNTPQMSLRVHIEGSTRPSEIVVLGGHVDSINMWQGPSGRAPGADDNASGSAVLLETLRVLLSQGQPQRSVEFFWYAAEEVGLVGSKEIAQQYRSQGKDVVAVLQLDMTLHPGAGENVIANVGDYTSAWLRDYLVELNQLYVGAELIEEKCGYACSDHASWYMQGFPTVMPFESDKRGMNRRIHSSKDVINAQSSFMHALSFAKLALSYAMDLSNSLRRQPY